MKAALVVQVITAVCRFHVSGATLAGVSVENLPFILDEIEVFRVNGVDTVTHNGTNKTVIYFGSKSSDFVGSYVGMG